MIHNWGNPGMADPVFGLFALLPLLFSLGIIILLIVLGLFSGSQTRLNQR